LGVNWRQWGKEAFDDARRMEKPLLLSISATWCHWCHVMDEKTYSDPKVVARIEQDFIPVRVDADRRPDIDRRYNMGGWPTTAFLTPDGNLIAGATYLPPQEMLQAMDAVLQSQDDRGLWRQRPLQRTGVQPEAADAILAEILLAYDTVYGGFGRAPKFPQPYVLRFLLEEYVRSSRDELREPLVKTLREMAEGGMYDQVEGGFFRYSTTRDWSIPHYEKMLEDNALLLGVYLDAYLATAQDEFSRIARDLCRFLLGPLRDEGKGVFYGSQEAHQEYYLLDQAGRAKLGPPPVDRTVYVNWNALACASLIRAADVLEEPHLAEQAERTLAFLLDECTLTSGPAYHYYADGPHLAGLLEDQTALAAGLMEAFQYTGKEEFLHRAEGLIDWACRSLWDDEAGCFRDTQESLLGPVWPFMENAGAALTLLKLHALTGEEDYRERVGLILGNLLARWKDYGYMAGELASALRLYAQGSITVVVSGPKAMELARIARREYLPGKVVSPGEPSDEDRALICVGDRCLAPVKTKEELRQSLSKIRTEPLRM
jgi:uncharacterized protein YyaL (SSP411 family)